MSDSKLTWEQAVEWLRAQPDQADLVRACYYDDPLIEAARRYYQSSEWAAVRQYLPNHKGCALDLGAGRGIASFALAMDGWKVTALEPDPSRLVGANAIRALASAAHLQIRVEEDLGERLPFASETFDLVHARQVLHHARDLGQLCREAVRVLKKGGVLVATREHVISRQEDLAKFQAAHPLHQLYAGENAYRANEYITALTSAGLQLTAVLNPMQSDINLFPQTRSSIRRAIASRLGLPAAFIPDWVLGWIGRLSRAPGRLYTFVGRKA